MLWCAGVLGDFLGKEGRTQMIRHIRRTDKAVVRGWAGLLAGQQGVCLVTQLDYMAGRA